jgi:hypothetical protein
VHSATVRIVFQFVRARDDVCITVIVQVTEHRRRKDVALRSIIVDEVMLGTDLRGDGADRQREHCQRDRRGALHHGHSLLQLYLKSTQ